MKTKIQYFLIKMEIYTDEFMFRIFVNFKPRHMGII